MRLPFTSLPRRRARSRLLARHRGGAPGGADVAFLACLLLSGLLAADHRGARTCRQRASARMRQPRESGVPWPALLTRAGRAGLQSLCDNPRCAVIPSGARNLALSIFKTVRDFEEPQAVLSEDIMILRLTTMHENGRLPLFRRGDRGWPATAFSSAVVGRVRVPIFKAAKEGSS